MADVLTVVAKVRAAKGKGARTGRPRTPTSSSSTSSTRTTPPSWPTARRPTWPPSASVARRRVWSRARPRWRSTARSPIDEEIAPGLVFLL